MQIRNINDTNPTFQAKWFKSKSLELVANYAVEKGKFEKLNQARKNIDSAYFKTRLRMDFGINDEGFPVVSFTRFEPKPDVIVPKYYEDYKIVKTVVKQSSKKENVLKFAFNQFIKLGNNAPHNNFYKNLIIKK